MRKIYPKLRIIDGKETTAIRTPIFEQITIPTDIQIKKLKKKPSVSKGNQVDK